MKKLAEIPIAHRGLYGNSSPENSLSAFRAAIENGYAIETDVHLTKDFFPVLFHDDTLLRMTGDSRKIFDCTKKELDLLLLKNSNEHIPLLSELLNLDRGKVPILLELKTSPVPKKEFLSIVAKTFEGYLGEYAVQSFQPLYVRGYKKLCPNISCGILTASNLNLQDFSPPFARVKRHIVSKMSLNFLIRPDFVSFEFHAPSEKVKRFKGVKFAWTVRSFEDEALARRHAKNIIFEGFSPSF